VATQGVPPTYLACGHAQADLVEGPQLAEAAVWDALRPVLEDPAVTKGVFDHKAAAHALRNAEVTLAGVAFDPMLVSYSLDPARSSHELDALAKDVLGHVLTKAETVTGKGRKAKPFDALGPGEVGPWACEQVWALQALEAALQPQIADAEEQARALLQDVEMPLCGVLTEIERRGIRIDTEVLRTQGAELDAELRRIQEGLAEESDEAVNLDSPLQLQRLLFEDWGLPPTRKIKTGYSTDAKALEQLAVLDPRVKYIQQYRQVSKLKNTYVDALPRLVREDSGRLHTTFAQAVAATGRLSSIDPNLQNIPIRTAQGRRIRDAFVAPEGQVLVAIDYSQIELRVLAHLSKDPNLMSAFIDEVDVHRRTAAEVFGVEESEVDDEQRRIAKAVNFGVVYGQTAHGLAQQLGIPRGKAGIYIRGYMEKIPGVDRYMRELIAIAKRRGYASTILGRRRRIPELARKGPARAHGERMARNTPIQGSAADIMKVAMIAVEQALGGVSWARVLLTVHDELIFECDEARVDELVGLCRPLMEGAVSLDVPLVVEAGSGHTWGACKS
jgi:DNA polymerase-1